MTKENETGFSLEEKNWGESSNPPHSLWTIHYHVMKWKNKLKRKQSIFSDTKQSMKYTSRRYQGKFLTGI